MSEAPDRPAAETLERIASGHPDVILAFKDNFLSPYEIDVADEDAIRRLLAAVVSAARNAGGLG